MLSGPLSFFVPERATGFEPVTSSLGSMPRTPPNATTRHGPPILHHLAPTRIRNPNKDRDSRFGPTVCHLVCNRELLRADQRAHPFRVLAQIRVDLVTLIAILHVGRGVPQVGNAARARDVRVLHPAAVRLPRLMGVELEARLLRVAPQRRAEPGTLELGARSEEHTSELQS